MPRPSLQTAASWFGETLVLPIQPHFKTEVASNPNRRQDGSPSASLLSSLLLSRGSAAVGGSRLKSL